MSLHRALKNQLVQSNLIAKSISGVKSFADLSAALIRKNKKAGNLISFDPDLDPSAQTYENLIQDFLKIADISSINDLTIEHSTDKDEFKITLTKNGEAMDSSWHQGTSTIAVEFIEFVESLLNNDNGRLIRLDQEDALTYLYLDKNLAYAIEEWRDNPNVERWSFWEKNILHWVKNLEDEHPILPLESYQRIRDNLSKNLLSGGNDPRSFSDYQQPSIELPYLTNSDMEFIDDDFPDGLGDYLEIDRKFYPGVENWVEDESCFVLVLDSPLNIAFEATPKKAEKIRGEISGHREFLYVDRHFAWSICFVHDNKLNGEYTPANNTLIISGDEIINKLSDRIRKHG